MDLIRLPFMSGTIRYRITNYHFAWTIERGGGAKKSCICCRYSDVETEPVRLHLVIITLLWQKISRRLNEDVLFPEFDGES